jgi:hypothetical protein
MLCMVKHKVYYMEAFDAFIKDVKPMFQAARCGLKDDEVIMARLTVFLIAGICFSTVLGCQSMPWQKKPMPPVELVDESGKNKTDTTVTTEKPAALELATSQRIKDVPLPAKAKEDLERSYIYETSDLQLGRMVYTIHAKANEVAQFYIDNTPAAGWRLLNVKQAEGGTEMLFRKEGKKLEVAISPLGLLRGQRLVLHLVPDQMSEAKY